MERDQYITAGATKYFEAIEKGSQTPFFMFLFYDSPHNYIFPSDYPTVFEPVAPAFNVPSLLFVDSS